MAQGAQASLLHELLWVCDSGKGGYLLLKIYTLSGSTDAALLRKATDCANFLARIQQADGDLSASIYLLKSGQAQVFRGPNFAGTCSAVIRTKNFIQVGSRLRGSDDLKKCL